MNLQKIKETLRNDMYMDIDTFKGKLQVGWRLAIVIGVLLIICTIIAAIIFGKSVIVGIFVAITIISFVLSGLIGLVGALFINNWGY